MAYFLSRKRIGEHSGERLETIWSRIHTSYCYGLFSIISPCEKYYVPLGGVYVVILQEEDLVDTILLQGRELDKITGETSKRSLYDEVLLSSNLASR